MSYGGFWHTQSKLVDADHSLFVASAHIIILTFPCFIYTNQSQMNFHPSDHELLFIDTVVTNG